MVLVFLLHIILLCAVRRAAWQHSAKNEAWSLHDTFSALGQARRPACTAHTSADLAAVDKSYLHILLQGSLWAPVCAPHQLLPLWDFVPASVNLLSASQPASHGRSCSDSGGRTLSPAGLGVCVRGDTKGQRCKASSCAKRIMAIDDLLRARQDKSQVSNGRGDFSRLISIIGPGDNT